MYLKDTKTIYNLKQNNKTTKQQNNKTKTKTKMSTVQQIVDKLTANRLEYANMYKLVETLLDDTTNFMTILGEVQCGKTYAMIVACVAAIEAGYIPLVITRNATCDGVQFIDRIKKILEELAENTSDVNIVQSEIIARMVKTESEFTSRTIYCSLGNSSQLNHFITNIYNDPEFKKEKLIILADEGDDIYYNNEQNSKQVQDTISILRQNCFKFIPVTATCDVILHAEKLARFSDVFILQTPANYKGINDIVFNTVIALKTKSSMAVKLDTIASVVNGIVSRPPPDTIKFVLVNVLSNVTHQQQYVMDCDLQLSRTVDGVNYRTVYMCMNYESYIIQADFDIARIIKNSNTTFAAVLKLQDSGNGRYIFKANKGEELKDILDILSFSRLGVKIGAIVLFCAQMASRGLSFVNTKRDVHITDMVCSEKLDLATAYQSMRILGNFNDNTVLTVHSPESFEVDVRTIVDNNRQKYDIINNVARVVRMPTELICDHIEEFEYTPTVTTETGEFPVSAKSFCSKIKGEIKLKKKASNSASSREGNYTKRANETIQEATDRVYGSGQTVVETTKHFRIHDGLKTLNTQATKEEKAKIRLETKIFLASNNPGRFSLHMVNKTSHAGCYFKSPWAICNTYIKDFYRSDDNIVQRIVDIKDYTCDDRVYAWHSHDGTINFGKDPTVANILERPAVSVTNNVLTVN
jgi:hypothetical protein